MREKLPASANGFPCFDFILLGLGPDGHTASLFPGTAAIDENKRCFVENFVEKFNTYRLTSTYPVLNAARNVVFLAEGEEKAAIIKTVLMEPEAHLPSQRVKPLNGQLEWFVDRAAASLLPNGTLTHK
jgi:6-phosphogluconolactonase